MQINPGYSRWKYGRSAVNQRVKEVIKAVHELRPRLNFDSVVLTGSSGTWLGGALQVHAGWPDGVHVVLCRKGSENSHGRLFEGAPGAHVRRALLIDDFVDSGATLNRVSEGLVEQGAELVGVLEHDRITGDHTLYVRHGLPRFGAPVFRRHDAWGGVES